MLASDEIAKRLREVRERIAQAAKRAARPPDAIRLVLASKTQPTEAIRAAYLAGCARLRRKLHSGGRVETRRTRGFERGDVASHRPSAEQQDEVGGEDLRH